jgi:hypothetical protein
MQLFNDWMGNLMQLFNDWMGNLIQLFIDWMDLIQESITLLNNRRLGKYLLFDSDSYILITI